MREATKITVTDGGEKLTFAVKPMSALKAEKWLYKAICVLGLPALSEVQELTPEGVIRALTAKPLDFDKAEPLLDDLLACCSRLTDGGVEIAVTPETVDGQIQYPTTLLLLRVAALKASFGFFANGGWQNFLAQLSGVKSAPASKA